MKTICLASLLFVSSLGVVAQSTSTPATQSTTTMPKAVPAPAVANPALEPARNRTSSPINQATIDVKDQTATDAKVQRAVTGTGPIQVPKNAKSRPANSVRPAAKKTPATKSSTRKTSKSSVTTRPDTQPRP